MNKTFLGEFYKIQDIHKIFEGNSFGASFISSPFPMPYLCVPKKITISQNTTCLTFKERERDPSKSLAFLHP